MFVINVVKAARFCGIERFSELRKQIYDKVIRLLFPNNEEVSVLYSLAS